MPFGDFGVCKPVALRRDGSGVVVAVRVLDHETPFANFLTSRLYFCQVCRASLGAEDVLCLDSLTSESDLRVGIRRLSYNFASNSTPSSISHIHIDTD